MADLLSSPLPYESANQSEKIERRRRLRDLLKLGRRSRESQPPASASAPLEGTPQQTPVQPGFGRRLSRSGLVGIPRSTTFERQEDHQRKSLTSVEPTVKERRDASEVRQRALSAVPEPPRHAMRKKIVPENPRKAYASIAERVDTDELARFTEAQYEQLPPPPPPLPQPPPPNHEAHDEEEKAEGSEGSYDDALDEQTMEELKNKWILNMSMHFQDKSPREKLFLTYVESPNRWRRVTVSCDYRNAPVDSLEHDLQGLNYQSAKSARIYEAIRTSQPQIQFYDTVTNLKLETKDDRLHVHVTEDVNETASLSPISWAPVDKTKSWADAVLLFLNRRRPNASPAAVTNAKASDDQSMRGRDTLATDNQVIADRPLSTGRDLPMIIKGRTIIAQPDSGAENCNIISSNLASEFKLRIKTGRADCRSFKMGNGKVVRAVGRVRVPCTFARDTKTKLKCWFYVFKSLAVPLIMGAEFLKITRTLTEFTHRLVDRLPFTSNLPSVNLIGSATQTKQRLSAFLDGRVTYINADSGCQVGDLMSPAYARTHGYKIDRREDCRKRLKFADGSVAQSIGQVTATLSMRNGGSYLKVFDVLPELISDVVLGEATLAQIDAFNVHSDSFVDVSDGERHLELAILVSLGSVSQSLAYHFRAVFARQKTRDQYQPSQAKQRDDEMMKEIVAEDAAKLREQHENHETAVSQGSPSG